jgi:hypothetical protein
VFFCGVRQIPENSKKKKQTIVTTLHQIAVLRANLIPFNSEHVKYHDRNLINSEHLKYNGRLNLDRVTATQPRHQNVHHTIVLPIKPLL